MLRRLHALLLLSYPAAFRRRFGDELRFAFQAGWDTARAHGLAATVRFIAVSLADALVSGLAERRSNRCTPPAPKGIP